MMIINTKISTNPQYWHLKNKIRSLSKLFTMDTVPGESAAEVASAASGHDESEITNEMFQIDSSPNSSGILEVNANRRYSGTGTEFLASITHWSRSCLSDRELKGVKLHS